MADIERIKRAIADLAKRPKSVRYEEIERIVNQLRQAGYSIGMRPFPHGMLFRIGRRQFGVVKHNPGSSQIKPCYVREFLNAMVELELLED